MMMRIDDLERRLQDLLLPLPTRRDRRSAIRAENLRGQERRRWFENSPRLDEVRPHPALPPSRPASYDAIPNAGGPPSQSWLPPRFFWFQTGPSSAGRGPFSETEGKLGFVAAGTQVRRRVGMRAAEQPGFAARRLMLRSRRSMRREADGGQRG